MAIKCRVWNGLGAKDVLVGNDVWHLKIKREG